MNAHSINQAYLFQNLFSKKNGRVTWKLIYGNYYRVGYSIYITICTYSLTKCALIEWIQPGIFLWTRKMIFSIKSDTKYISDKSQLVFCVCRRFSSFVQNILFDTMTQTKIFRPRMLFDFRFRCLSITHHSIGKLIYITCKI